MEDVTYGLMTQLKITKDTINMYMPDFRDVTANSYQSLVNLSIRHGFGKTNKLRMVS